MDFLMVLMIGVVVICFVLATRVRKDKKIKRDFVKRVVKPLSTVQDYYDADPDNKK